ncbi:MAG TPA: energy transducer TonB, partial [Rhodobiaceae bacterium]|nr:energy transducer TonB [Rhodobiaceae bacterium]
GSSRLDRGGIDTVTRADPFPPVPQDISRDPFEVVVPIRFNLDR